VQKTAITDLLEAGVHFGHQTKRWNPKMKPYIFGTRNGITIFDLTKTMHHLAESCAFLRDTAAAGGKILFVGAKRQAQEVVRGVAEKTNMFFMCDRWLGGTLTNHRVVLSRVAYLQKLRGMEEDGTMDTLPKKEVAGFRRERGKLERTLGGIVDMKKLPQAMVVVDVGREHIAVAEAKKLGIPVVGLVDSNCAPDQIDHVIPGNDDALRSIKIIMDTLCGAVIEGLNMGGKSEDVAVEAPAPAAEPAPVTEPEAPELDVEEADEESEDDN
jgi:small subunit ribosomal protein S2